MKRVLVSPLDWGLGHASRLVPIIRQLNEDGHEVIIAADQLPLAFLRKEFPELEWVRLGSYQVHYTKKASSFAWSIAMQAPKILSKIWEEHRALKKIVAEKKIDVVISDNRFGLYHRGIKTVFMTHQVAIQVPNENPILERMIFAMNKWFIRKYDEVWIPDYEGGQLSGKLTQKYKLPVPVTYLGNLSRFYKTTPEEDPSLKAEIVAVLSGPEPQRTLLEEKLTQQMLESGKKCVLVQGLPSDEIKEEQINENFKKINFLTAKPLASLYSQAETVVCRAGYSSIMDLIALGKKACLIPTPGQTEQEYLGEYLNERKWFYSEIQDKFELKTALEEIQSVKLPDHFQRVERLPIEL